jgi:hypothetical protein
MVTRERLRSLVEILPETEVPTAVRVMEALSGVAQDEHLAPIDAAPGDDEPESEEERPAVAEAKAALARGEVVSHADIRREFGL